MGVVFWIRIAALFLGAASLAYGCYVLATGRLTRRARASFRSNRDAGMYSVCTGVGVILLVIAQFFISGGPASLLLTLAALALAMVFMGLAVIRYRPGKANFRR